jgi:hypothetical protein
MNLDINPVTNNWVGFTFGRDATDRAIGLRSSGRGLGVLFYGESSNLELAGRAVIHSNGIPVATNLYASDPSGYHNVLVKLIGLGDGNPFDGVGPTTMELHVNGSSTPFMTYTVPSGFTNNYIVFEGAGIGPSPNVADHTFNSVDNLTIFKQAPPSLTAMQSAGQLILSWLEEGYVVESSTNLPADQWVPVPGVNGNSVTVETTNERAFYRLRSTRVR